MNGEEMRKENDLELLNEIRKVAGLPPVVPKERKCLKCNVRFSSTGAHHRLCDACLQAMKEK